MNTQNIEIIDEPVSAIEESKGEVEGQPRFYQRFTVSQRYLHGFLALTFLGLAMTGLPLRFSGSSWAIGFARAVGGFGTVLFFHLVNAVILTAAFLIHVAHLIYRLVKHKDYKLLWGNTSMVPNLKDLQDIIAQVKWFLFLGPKPKFDRFSYWDKVDYWGVFWGMAIIGFSGYAMWFAPFFARFIPGSWLNIALLIHGEEALLAAGYIFIIHFFNTHLRPGNFPMDMVIFTGRQSEEELKEKHPEEYDRLVKNGELEKLRVAPPPRWLINFGRVFGTSAVALGIFMIVLTIGAFIKE
jgi:cytochrome b subunit of formate dehydrogenase